MTKTNKIHTRGLARLGEARRGRARQGRAWRGKAWRGKEVTILQKWILFKKLKGGLHEE